MTHRWNAATVESGGESIYYEITGADDAAETVVLTHGAGGSHAAWFQQVPALADAGYRVVTWDSRGFGNSTFTSGVLCAGTTPSAPRGLSRYRSCRQRCR